MTNKYCEWCDNGFEASVSYQIYCGTECREEATKAKIAKRYEKKRRNRLIHKSRKCRACGSKLSAYNDEQICNSCIVNPKDVNRAIKDIKRIADEFE